MLPWSRLELRRVVFGCANERFGGNGSILNVHKDAETLADYHAYEVESGVMGESHCHVPALLRDGKQRAPEGKRKRKGRGRGRHPLKTCTHSLSNQTDTLILSPTGCVADALGPQISLGVVE